jgi:hypothetical protein
MYFTKLQIIFFVGMIALYIWDLKRKSTPEGRAEETMREWNKMILDTNAELKAEREAKEKIAS